MKASPNAFFYNEGSDVTISEDEDTILIDSALNNYFNDADYYIGQHIDAMILKLNARK